MCKEKELGTRGNVMLDKSTDGLFNLTFVRRELGSRGDVMLDKNTYG